MYTKMTVIFRWIRYISSGLLASIAFAPNSMLNAAEPVATSQESIESEFATLLESKLQRNEKMEAVGPEATERERLLGYYRRRMQAALKFYDAHPGNAFRWEAVLIGSQARERYMNTVRFLALKPDAANIYHQTRISEQNDSLRRFVSSDPVSTSAEFHRLGMLAEAALCAADIDPVIYASFVRVKIQSLAQSDFPCYRDYRQSGADSGWARGILNETEYLVKGIEARFPNGATKESPKRFVWSADNAYYWATWHYLSMIRRSKSEKEYALELVRIGASKFETAAEKANYKTGPNLTAAAIEALADTNDGPYAVVQPDGRIEVVYADVSDEVGYERRSSMANFNERIRVDAVGARPSFEVTLRPASNEIAQSVMHLPNDAPLFIMADSHGQYEVATELLIKQGVINASLNWTFGNGRLVVLGDILDRGARQTELMWLLYKLDAEAKESGGDLVVLLGNHEIMALGGDDRYLNRKYKRVGAALGVARYSELWNSNSILGQWLRRKATVCKMGEILCLHAGVSQDIIAGGFSLDEINAIVRDSLNSVGTTNSRSTTVLGPTGPLWFRGYFPKYQKNATRAPTDIENTQTHFGIRRIAVGHTIVNMVTPLYDGSVVAVQVYPTTDPETGKMNMEGVYIDEQGTWHKAKIDGTREPLKNDKGEIIRNSPPKEETKSEEKVPEKKAA